MKPAHLTFALTLSACSGHQTFDDGSDALGGRKIKTQGTQDSAVAEDAAAAENAALAEDAGTARLDRGSNVLDAATGDDNSSDAGHVVPVGQVPHNTSPTHNETQPPESVELTCYGEGTNEDASFANAQLECNQTYCRAHPDALVVLPWSVDTAPPCRTALGNVCETQLDEGDFLYRIEDGPFSLEFAFDPQLGQAGFTDEAFTAHFLSLTMRGMRDGQTQQPASTSSDTPDFRWVRYDVRWEARELYDAGYSFANGRFGSGEITGTVTTVYYDLAEQFPTECVVDDVAIDCKCHLDGLEFDYQLRLETQLVP